MVIDYPFKYVEPFLQSSDYVTGNLESPVTLQDDYEAAEKSIYFQADREIVSTLQKMNFTVLNFANNHAMDYYENGLLDTKRAFQQENLDLVGYGENLH